LIANWPPGVGLVCLDEIDSTNEEARRRAAAGEAGHLWIMAQNQTAGRGRRGLAWETTCGSLAATLLLRPDAPPQQAAQLGFAAALAVTEMVAHFAPEAEVTVKWPNDVLGRGRKLAGILLEAGTDWLAIGVGVNLAHFLDETEFPSTSLVALGADPPAPEMALAVLAARFADWFALWKTDGFAPLRSAWLARAEGMGAPIRARLPHAEHCGTFEGIDANGALLLREATGLRSIMAGEVFF
jgi:BirA family transcriptional regulator, biotin operon repressor / biotin---[acetyl-CoA-carboxylase] ligase